MVILSTAKLGKQAKDLTYNEIVQPLLMEYSKWLFTESLRKYVHACKNEPMLKLGTIGDDNISNDDTNTNKGLSCNSSKVDVATISFWQHLVSRFHS